MEGQNLVVSHSLYKLALRMPRTVDHERVTCDFKTDVKRLEIDAFFTAEEPPYAQEEEEVVLESQKQERVQFECKDLFELY